MLRMVAAAAALAAVVAALWQLRPGTQAPPMVVPFTSFAGVEETPAFSPDGERVAFSWDGPTRDNVDIYVKAMSGEPTRLTNHPAADRYPAFSPDGSLIAFVRERTRVFVVPAQGGSEREVGTVSDPRTRSPRMVNSSPPVDRPLRVPPAPGSCSSHCRAALAAR